MLVKINCEDGVCSSETTVTTYKTEKYHDPDVQNLNSDYQINLKSDSTDSEIRRSTVDK
jgi:hypothetical protein